MASMQQVSLPSPFTYPVVVYGTDQAVDEALAQLQSQAPGMERGVKQLRAPSAVSRATAPDGSWLPLGQMTPAADEPTHHIVHVPVSTPLSVLRQTVTRRGLAGEVAVDRPDLVAYPEGDLGHGPSGVPYLLEKGQTAPVLWDHNPFSAYAPGNVAVRTPRPVTIAILDSFPQRDWQMMDIPGLVGYHDYVSAEHAGLESSIGEIPDWSLVMAEALSRIYGQAYRVKPVWPQRNAATWRMLHRYHGLTVAAICQQLMPQARFIFLRVLSDNGYGYSTDMIEALDDLRRVRSLIEGPLLVNASLGLKHTDRAGVDNWGLLRSIRHLVNRPGYLTALLCATGNDSQIDQRLSPQEPAAYGYMDDDDDVFSHVIPVAAVDTLSILDNRPQLANFSNRAPLAVPATHMMLSTTPQDVLCEAGCPKQVLWAGTSFATPVVCGLVARMLAAEMLSADNLKHDLWRHAHKTHGIALVEPLA